MKALQPFKKILWMVVIRPMVLEIVLMLKNLAALNLIRSCATAVYSTWKWLKWPVYLCRPASQIHNGIVCSSTRCGEYLKTKGRASTNYKFKTPHPHKNKNPNNHYAKFDFHRKAPKRVKYNAIMIKLLMSLTRLGVTMEIILRHFLS